MICARTAGSSTTSSSTASPPSASWSCPTPSSGGRGGRPGERLDGFDGGAGRRVAARPPRRRPGPAARELLAPLTDVDLAALQYYAIAEGTSPGPGARRAHRLHRRGRLRAVRRERTRPPSSGTRCCRRGRRALPVRPRRARHAPARGRACRSTATSSTRHQPVRGRPRPRRQAREAGRLRRPGGARAGRPDGPRKRSSASRSRRGIARHGYRSTSAIARRASSRAAPSRRRSASRSRPGPCRSPA